MGKGSLTGGFWKCQDLRKATNLAISGILRKLAENYPKIAKPRQNYTTNAISGNFQIFLKHFLVIFR